MKKQFTLWAACALPLITPLGAQNQQPDVAKLQADHERLVDLVLSLQADFGETLRDYGQLQKDYAELLKRPEVPDQSGKVKELQEKLNTMAARLKEASRNTGTPDELVLGDLKALRAELHQERAALLVAKAQLVQFQKLEGKVVELEKLLAAETTRGTETLAKLEAVRGERDALMARLDGMLKQAAESEMAMKAANQRIQILEKETGELKGQIAQKDAEIQKLNEGPAPDKDLMMAMEKLEKEGSRLAGVLEEREKELVSLRSDLDAERKKALDVPILLQASKELEGRLETNVADLEATREKLAEAEKMAATAAALEAENQALMQKYERLMGNFKSLQGAIKAMEEELFKNRETMAAALKAGMQVEELELQRNQLTKDLKTAHDTLAKVEGDLKETTVKLNASEEKSKEAALMVKRSEEAVATAEKLKAEYEALNLKAGTLEAEKAALAADLTKRDEELKSLRAEMAGKPDLSETVAKLEEQKEKLEADYAAGLLVQKALKLRLDESSMQLRKASEQSKVASKLEADFADLTKRTAALEKEKAVITADLSNRDVALKSLREELSEREESAPRIAQLESEKKNLEDQLAAREADLKKVRMDLGKLHLDSASMEKQLISLKRSSAQIDPVRYAKGEADVKDQQSRVLSQVQQVLELFPSSRFEIVGHTCDLGSKEVNLRLSNERAKSLQDFLISKGVPAERLKARGVADAEPVVPNTNEENRRKNRRVEIEILD